MPVFPHLADSNRQTVQFLQRRAVSNGFSADLQIQTNCKRCFSYIWPASDIAASERPLDLPKVAFSSRVNGASVLRVW